MARNKDKRLCSKRSNNGEACRCYAVRGTDPALCSAHGGRNVGAGAPAGNQNGVKHGFYGKFVTAEEMAEADKATVADELRLLRVGLRRLADYLEREDLTVMEVTALMTLMCRAVRTVGYLEPRVLAQRKEANLDVVLDEVGRGLGMEL